MTIKEETIKEILKQFKEDYYIYFGNNIKENSNTFYVLKKVLKRCL